MPGQRGSARGLAEVRAHGENLVALTQVIAAIVRRGYLPATTATILERASEACWESYEPLPGRQEDQDRAFAEIGALAGAGGITKHVRELRSKHRRAARMDAA